MRFTIREDVSPVLKLVTHGAGCTKQNLTHRNFGEVPTPLKHPSEAVVGLAVPIEHEV